jgi:hypothetical protein
VTDAEDRCPDVPERNRTQVARDGCPDPDRDADAVPDAVDQCPAEPDDFIGDRADAPDGCPRSPTRSKNEEAGAQGGEGATKGTGKAAPAAPGCKGKDCPVADSDGDEVPDDRDRCPTKAEDFLSAPADGCPEE